MSILDLIFLNTKKSIGKIEIMAVVEEVHNDELTITEHPVERGAPISDHAFKRPAEVTLKCGWTNASFTALSGAIKESFLGGSMSKSDYISSVYSQLLALQQSRELIDVVTSKRLYSNMLLQGLTVVTDPKTSEALMATATLREVIIVTTQATTLPPRNQQADPSKTAEAIDGGTKSAVTATPSPGGAVPPEDH